MILRVLALISICTTIGQHLKHLTAMITSLRIFMLLVALINCGATANFISYILITKYHLNLKVIPALVIMGVKGQLLIKLNLKGYY